MGQLISKKPRLEINEADRAVLTLKTQARKLEQQRQRIQGNVDREMGIAASLVAQGKKDRALLALKRKKLQEGQLAKLDAYLLNVEEMLGNLELTKNQQQLMAALKQGNTAMKEMQQAMPLEEVEKLMQDSADAKEYEQSLRQLLGESLNPEEAEAAEEELHQLEQQLLDEHVLEMPRVPSGKEAAASAARQEQPAATAAGGAAAGAAEGGQQLEASLAELPSVPNTKVQPQQPVQAEAAAEQEPERVLVAA